MKTIKWCSESLKRCINTVLGFASFELVRKERSRRNESPINPRERNEKRTLDRLWRDREFKAQYLNSHRKKIYSDVIQTISGHGKLISARSIIDVGCGPGFFLEALKAAGFKGSLAGCDFSEGAIESAREVCLNATLFTQDIYQPLDDNYDLIFCMETLEHLLHPDKALANLVASAKTVVLTVPEGRSDSFAGHINFWSLESWEVFIGTAAERSSRDFEVKLINDGKNIYGAIWE